MKSLPAEQAHVDDIEDFLASRKKLNHLRARRRGDAIILESGPKTDPSPHARLRRISVNRWSLDMPDHRGRWEPTPYIGLLEPLLSQLVNDFPWAMAPIDP